MVLSLKGGIPRRTPPWTPRLFRTHSRAVNNRIEIDSMFTGPKVVRIIQEDYVISFSKKKFRSPRQLSKLMGRGEFMTLRFDQDDSLLIR
jgi:hypothetical protein